MCPDSINYSISVTFNLTQTLQQSYVYMNLFLDWLVQQLAWSCRLYIWWPPRNDNSIAIISQWSIEMTLLPFFSWPLANGLKIVQARCLIPYSIREHLLHKIRDPSRNTVGLASIQYEAAQYFLHSRKQGAGRYHQWLGLPYPETLNSIHAYGSHFLYDKIKITDC